MSLNPLKSPSQLTSYLGLFACALLLDRMSKHWVLKYVIGNVEVNRFLNLAVQWNRGVSFSFFHCEGTLGFLLLTAVIIAIVVLFGFYTWGQYRRGYSLMGEMLVLGGAVSNIIDRFWHGAVLDFIDVHWGSWHFAVFNLADTFVFLGIVLVFSTTFFNTETSRTSR